MDEDKLKAEKMAAAKKKVTSPIAASMVWRMLTSAIGDI